MTVSTSGARHLLFRLAPPARLPEAMIDALREEVVLAGWVRASGVLSDVQIRVADARSSSTSAPRRIAGPVQLVMLEGSVGLASGDVSCGLRVVLSRETDSGGLETIAGDLIEARVNALEVLVIAFDELTATRALDASGVWLLDPGAPPPRAGGPTSPAAAPRAASGTSPPPRAQVALPSSGFSAAVRASEVETMMSPIGYIPPLTVTSAPAAPTPPPRPSPTFSNSNAMPARIAKPMGPEEEDQAIPEPGDVVEHFAFGRCEVVKTDGDRLHVRLPKDQRVKEIALEMLKVSMLEPEAGQTTKHWKLARKL